MMCTIPMSQKALDARRVIEGIADRIVSRRFMLARAEVKHAKRMSTAEIRETFQIDKAPVPKQCKDINDLPIIEFLYGYSGESCNLNFGNERDVHNAMPNNTPPKLVLGKMRSLIGRGLVDGCGCGCRGDFRLTSAGESYLFWKRRLQEQNKE